MVNTLPRNYQRLPGLDMPRVPPSECSAAGEPGAGSGGEPRGEACRSESHRNDEGAAQPSPSLLIAAISLPRLRKRPNPDLRESLPHSPGIPKLRASFGRNPSPGSLLSPPSPQGRGPFSTFVFSPLPRGEGGPLPALLPAGAGRVRGHF